MDAWMFVSSPNTTVGEVTYGLELPTSMPLVMQHRSPGECILPDDG